MAESRTPWRWWRTETLVAAGRECENMSIKWYRWYVYMRTQCFEMLVECGVYCDFPFAVKTKDKQTDSLMYLYFTTAEEKKQKRKSALTTLTWQNKKTPHNEVDTLSIYSPARANGYANLKGDCFSFSMLPSGMTFYDRQIILVHFRLIFCTRNSQLFTVVATINRSTSQFCVCFFPFFCIIRLHYSHFIRIYIF